MLTIVMGVLSIPFVLWQLLDPRWHPYILVASALIAGVGGLYLRQRKRREAIEDRKGALPPHLWLWPKRLNAEGFRPRIEIFLRSRGWHVISSVPALPDALRIVAQKDRTRIALHLARTETPPDGAVLRGVSAFQREAAAGQSAYVSDLRYAHAARQAASDASVRLMRFADLDAIDVEFAPPP
jgi:hypothetical protein